MSPPAMQGVVPIVQIADRALDWVGAHLDHFNPILTQTAPDPKKLKALVELALLCMCLQRQPAWKNDKRLHQSLELGLATYHSPLFRERMFRTGRVFMPYTLLAATLHTTGVLDDHDDWQALQRLVDHSNVTATERVPHRTLELLHLLDLAGFDHQLASYATLYQSCILSQQFNPIYTSNTDAYAITHAIFYLSDWGFQAPTVIPAADRERISWMTEQLLGMYVRKGDWDIAGELLLSCHCLRQTDSILYRLGWDAMIDAQWPDGAVPGPTYDAETARAKTGEERADYLFQHCYHTTLVAAFAGGLCPPPVAA